MAHIFSSDLQRAAKTAEAIRSAQPESDYRPSEVTKLSCLREQDFGFYEGKVFFERPKDSNKSGKDVHLDAHRNEPGFQDVESKDAMKVRSDRFIDEYLFPVFDFTEDEHSVLVVAHGIILAHLWRCILRRFPAKHVYLDPGASTVDRQLTLEYLGGFSNTGYLELDISGESKFTTSGVSSPVKRKHNDQAVDAVSQGTGTRINDVAETLPTLLPPAKAAEVAVSTSDDHPLKMLLDKKLAVIAVNCVEHLKGLKKTRGGIGSLKHDEGQKTMDSFFKKRRME